jgi:hypothetical protein
MKRILILVIALLSICIDSTYGKPDIKTKTIVINLNEVQKDSISILIDKQIVELEEKGVEIINVSIVNSNKKNEIICFIFYKIPFISKENKSAKMDFAQIDTLNSGVKGKSHFLNPNSPHFAVDYASK